jgi:hypothetical protein
VKKPVAPVKKAVAEPKPEADDGEEVKTPKLVAAASEEPEGFNQDRENEK